MNRLVFHSFCVRIMRVVRAYGRVKKKLLEKTQKTIIIPT